MKTSEAMDQNIESNLGSTVVIAGDATHKYTSEELRKMLGVPTEDDIRNYDGLNAIGMGGLGAVFAAREPGLEREVALKMLRPEFRYQKNHIESFLQEARITAAIGHPNIVPVHRIGVFEDAGIYFTMKRIEGETLRSVIKKIRDNKGDYRRKYTLQRRIEIFVGICQAIAFAHKNNVIHRDLKPGNVMLGDYGEVMLMDWGLATSPQKCAAEPPPVPGETKCVISGTPAFMAPEQAAGHNNLIDERTDIYSLGAILYTLLTLEAAPYDATLPTEKLLAAVISHDMVRPRRRSPLLGIPRELDAITVKCMAKNREDRYQTTAGLIRDLRCYLDKYPVDAYGKSSLYRLIKLCLRRPLIPVTILAALLTFAGVAAVQYADNTIRTNSLIEQIKFNSLQSDAYYNLAKRTYRQLHEDSNAGFSALRRKQLGEEFERQTVDFFTYTNATMDSLYLLSQTPGHKSFIIATMSELMHRQWLFCRSTGTQNIFKSLLKQFRSRWRTLIPDMLMRNRRIAAIFRQYENNVGTLIVDSPPGVAMFIARNDLDAPNELEWTPLSGRGNELSAGSYLVRAVKDGVRPVIYPILLSPADELTLRVLKTGSLPDDMVLIPGGATDEGFAGFFTGRKDDIASFMLKRHEVTFGEYLEFWKQITDPRERKICRALVIDGDRHVRYLWDDSGKLLPHLTPRQPVVGISPQAAELYCRYISDKLKISCRLPTVEEWQRAARGVDGRIFVWGNEPDAGAALLNDNPAAGKFPHGAPGGSFRQDRSSYGVYDMVGNVREFVRHGKERSNFSVMGGSYLTGIEAAHCDAGSTAVDGQRDVGFRYAADFTEQRQD